MSCPNAVIGHPSRGAKVDSRYKHAGMTWLRPIISLQLILNHYSFFPISEFANTIDVGGTPIVNSPF
jgi:hypothetical protein